MNMSAVHGIANTEHALTTANIADALATFCLVVAHYLVSH